MKVTPIVLEGEFVRLEPLTRDHLPALIEVGMEPVIWKWTNNVVNSSSDIERYVDDALKMLAAGTALPFVTVSKAEQRIVGSTRFGNIEIPNRKAEIGWTWVNPQWQRTAINTEAKLLMLTHAFETWKCIRVELKTDSNNSQSRAAIARIGAKEEGILRNHMITESGRFRHSVYFSILDTEWESVKAALTSKLAKTR
jgi:RimJ/RimL family protein N-acetyltransferase